MTNSVYKVVELVGTSSESWEKAASNIVSKASETLRDIRIAEVKSMDIHVNNGKIEYRTKLNVSFKYDS